MTKQISNPIATIGNIQPTINADKLLYTGFDSVENFLLYAELCVGMEPASAEYQLLKQLVTLQEQLDRFVDLYDGDMSPNSMYSTALQMLN